MKTRLYINRLIYILCLLLTCSGISIKADASDSVYLFSYASLNNGGRTGLHMAWSTEGKDWKFIGPEFRFLSCDYGPWGAEKRMINPFLMQGPDGLWHCVWSLNEYDPCFAHAASEDLISWKRQSYPRVMEGIPGGNCHRPELYFDKDAQHYVITWLSEGAQGGIYYSTTKNFKDYSPGQKGDESLRMNTRQEIQLDEQSLSGIINKLSRNDLQALINRHQLDLIRQAKWNEQCKDDPQRFAGLKSLNASIRIDAQDSKAISPLLMGIFFEDISYAADGGIYAEMVQNRGFEYHPDDKQGQDRSWNSKKAWRLKGDYGRFSIDTVSPLHPNNPHYAVLELSEPGTAISLVNEGFDGFVFKTGEKYSFSLFARNLDKKKCRIYVRLTDKEGNIYGKARIGRLRPNWRRYKAVIKSSGDLSDGRLEVYTSNQGRIALDMISLFPKKTFKKRKNGLRDDLAQSIADLHPRFVRFPGGCVAHGDGLDNMYRWKNTIGPLESRKPRRNIWNYHQSFGLGYFEYFQFCEDLGAEPIPIVPAGVPCQNSRHGGQQGGIPLCEMDDYVQEVLDLIEYANGSKRSTWGKKRAQAGHPKPFNLKYIGVGNEDLITDVFEERFTRIYEAIREKHPEITVIGTVGPFFEGTDYDEGWDIATKLKIPMVDEHYYVSPGWMIYNQDFYDNYDRSKSQVYLGEYAAHLPGRPNNLETALAEALYLTALERNGDHVRMTSYAPLLAKEGHTNWNPDLIYFNNQEVKPTVGYYVQQLYGQHSGDVYFSNDLRLFKQEDAHSGDIHEILSSQEDEKLRKRVACSVVKDSKRGDVIIKLVNLLPVEIATNIELEGLNIPEQQAHTSVLSGQPSDKNLRPVSSTTLVSKDFSRLLPPYSFTLILIRQQ